MGRSGAAFLGIPYGTPPLGSLRWKPPQPAKKWNGVRPAKQFGKPCAQLPAKWFPYIEGNEDCLYLNVWTPQLHSDAKLPVLVFFHGGSNTQGYSQMVPLGPPLSKYGVVVVSANYRIGPFGFLAHPLLTAESEHHSSGNYGLLDQIQALKWTQFAKTGSPNSSNSPRWLAYGENPNHAFELGRRIGLRPINPRVPRVAEVMERIVKNTDVATRSAQK